MSPRSRAVSVPRDDETRAEDAFETDPLFALAACRWLASNDDTGGSFGLGLQPPRILEPSAGNGSFVEAARKVWPNAALLAAEIREECRVPLTRAGADVTLIGDFLKLDPTTISQVYLAVGNPPYGGKEPIPFHLDPCNHIRHALRFVGRGGYLVFLLKLAFLCTSRRVRGRAARGNQPAVPAFWPDFPLWLLQPVEPRLGFIVPQAILDEWAEWNAAEMVLAKKEGRKAKLRKPTNDLSEYALMVWRADGRGGVMARDEGAILRPTLSWKLLLGEGP